MSHEDFLVEIGTEELPPKALKTLGSAFLEGITAGLEERNLGYSEASWYASPRRLAVIVANLEQKAPDQSIEVLGPPEKIAFDSNGAPGKPAQAFAAKNGIAVDTLEVVDSPKGRRLIYRDSLPGISAQDAMPAIVTRALEQLPIPKRMHWSDLRELFVRPVHWVVMLMGEQPISAEILGIHADRHTRGHRFHSPGAIAIQAPCDYVASLQQEGRVIADFAQRRETIRNQVNKQAEEIGARAVIDADLLDEVTALVEWPVAMTGRFEDRFLEVPQEALISSMKSHQKYFHAVDQDGKLSPHFIFVANIESSDPAKVVEGNERVIRPRLADAAFFYETDKLRTLESRQKKLDSIVFQAELGTLWDKSIRVAKLAKFIAHQIGCDSQLAERAALLAKTDLLTEMVQEFNDLQGIAGYYYALNDGEPKEIAQAIKEHYLPGFAGDKLPDSCLGCALALADRLDTLIGIFGINQAPSGSKDPFGLRRSVLGIIRITREKRLIQLDLNDLIFEAKAGYGDALSNPDVEQDVSNFFFDRYRSMYQDEGIRTNTITAVQQALQGNSRLSHNPYDVSLRVLAVEEFQDLAEAQALAAANKRIQNILAKQADVKTLHNVKPTLLESEYEKVLNQHLVKLAASIPSLCENQEYSKALSQLAELKEPVDAFFDHVMVMDENPALRNNRLSLLNELHKLFIGIADIAQLQNLQKS